ncbi:MAG: hypothetical protein R2706_15465 [Acidimicrobiales bacterium]
MPTPTSIYNTLRAAFSHSLDAPWIVQSDGTTMTYRGLDTESARAAAALQQLGVQPGDRALRSHR